MSLLQVRRVGDDAYLVYEINGSGEGGVTPNSGVRPDFCKTPQNAESYAMGICQYEYNKMKRCGCPPCDPEKHPELWDWYILQVRTALQALKKQKKERIRITLFGSGNLLNDYNMLTEVFEDLEFEAVILQFVDKSYKVPPGRWTTPFGMTTKEHVAIGCALGIAGLISGGVAVSQENRKAKVGLGAVGVISMIGAMVFLATASENQFKIENPKKSHVPEDTVIEDFTVQVSTLFPPTSRIKCYFFADFVSCASFGKNCDLLLGYDTGGEMKDFERLQSLTVDPCGTTVLVTTLKQTDGFASYGAAIGARKLNLLPWIDPVQT